VFYQRQLSVLQMLYLWSYIFMYICLFRFYLCTVLLAAVSVNVYEYMRVVARMKYIMSYSDNDRQLINHV